MNKQNALGLIAALVVALAAGCGGSGVGADGVAVGAACSGDGDCERRCVLGDSHYPGGMCTFACSTDADCPIGTSCIDDEGGICAVNCVQPADCSGFGRGFTCDSRDRKGPGGKALICRVN